MDEAQEVKLKQPKGLWILSFTAIWERFSYYGMRAFLILYMTNDIMNPANRKAHLGGLGFTDSDAGLVYGTFTAMCYLLPLLGGFLADRFLGKRKSVIIGSVLIMIGHFTLASNISAITFFIGLVVLALGNGFFKPNCSSMIGDLYTPGDKRRDSGFTIFYMLFNGGAGAAPILCGLLGGFYGYQYGFMVAGFAMMFGLIIYLIAAQKYLGDIGKYPIYKQNIKNNVEKKPLTKEEKQRIAVIFILMFFVIFFWAGFEQAGATFNLYTDRYIDKTIFGWELPAPLFQSINPLLILILGAPVAALWIKLAKKKKNPSTPTKMGLGMIALGVGFLFMVGAVMQRGGDSTDTTIKASLLWMFMTYLLHTIGELFLSPIGLSMVTKLAPAKNASLFMGLWFAAIGIANFLSGAVVGFVAKLGALEVFLGIAAFVATLGVVVLILSKRLLKMMHGVD
jgi:proton-dependent oligopeptide transporter, POT family